MVLTIASLSQPLQAQRLSRDQQVTIIVNQIGFTPSAPKFCFLPGTIPRPFQVINTATQEVALRGYFRPAGGNDFGNYLTGDFSKVQTPGTYYIVSDTLRSWPFVINNHPYLDATRLIVHYFSLQRCGPSTTGYLAPCHLDDGIRSDNGKHQDVTGGWHDACDTRKWVSATLYGMLGLEQAYDHDTIASDRAAIVDELKWGNQYFLKMQEPAGYVMDFVGGEIKQGGDNNRWTDNVIAKPAGPMHLTPPNAGQSNAELMIYGSSDDRIIQTNPVDLFSEYNFITAEAQMARITKTIDPSYSHKCLEAANHCFDWTVSSNESPTPGTFGAAIEAMLALYRTTGQPVYGDEADRQASRLMSLQDSMGTDIGGFFYSSPADTLPYKQIWHGTVEFISLCDLYNAFPDHPHAGAWKKSITRYTDDYLEVLTSRNAFNIMPYGLFTGNDPGGARRVGQFWYRYFMVPQDWWVGINANLGSMAVGMAKAAKILHDDRLRELAQHQLDWIVGVNPFNSSTMLGVGHNQPKLFVNGNEFRPPTPYLPGAVMNGIGGTMDDQPDIGDGNYHVSEYWTPMVAYTLWAMEELGQ